jgi:hypothetical protein
MPVEYSYIAAIARRHNLTVATGNVKDFQRPGVKYSTRLPKARVSKDRNRKGVLPLCRVAQRSENACRVNQPGAYLSSSGRTGRGCNHASRTLIRDAPTRRSIE